MSYLSKLKRHGMVGNLVVTAEYAGASYAFGYLQNAYRNKAQVLGVPMDLAAGVTLKAASLALNMFGMGRALAPHLDLVGTAGVGAFFHTLGAGHGAKKAGVRRLLIKSSDEAKARATFPDATVLGDLGKAPQGAFLTPSQLAEMAR